MTNGAVIFAQNNSAIDYVKIATFSAKQVKRYLNMPVSLVTDSPEAVTEADVFDQIIVIDSPANPQTKLFNDGALAAKHNVENE